MNNSSAMATMSGMMIFDLLVVVFFIIVLWRIFVKAGKPGWAAIIPIYNLIVFCQIVGKPAWWFLLLCIPVVNIVILIIMLNNLSKAFGKGTGFTVGLFFLGFIFMPILAFGKAVYKAP